MLGIKVQKNSMQTLEGFCLRVSLLDTRNRRLAFSMQTYLIYGNNQCTCRLFAVCCMATYVYKVCIGEIKKKKNLTALKGS